MPTSYTTLLGLALPVQGELQGTWGDEVNNYITNYLDASVAGTQTLSTDADVTLTKTTGTALGATSSQYAILNCTGARSQVRNITVPAQSKTYIVINATTGGFAVTLRGAGPTTGVSIANGERAVCTWNGSDFVKVSGQGGTGTFTNLTVSGTTTLSGLTASTALALNASKEVVSVTNTGTGNNVLATSPTLTTPILGTPQSVTLTNATGLPVSTGISGLGTGVATALGQNVTGSGGIALATSPSFTTPVLGAATATSINGLTISTTTGTLTLANGSTLATSGANSLTLTTTGATNVTLPTSGTLATTGGTVASFSAGTTGFTPNTATTGAVTLAGTLATTNGGTGLTSFTANGVVYASSTSALATGSALTFDGSVFAVGRSTPTSAIVSRWDNANDSNRGAAIYLSGAAGSGLALLATTSSGYPLAFGVDGNEQMRLTSTGLGIGTSSPISKLDVVETATIKRVTSGNNMDLNFYNGSGVSTQGNVARIRADGDGLSNDYGALSFWTGRINTAPISERMRLDSSGNLGLGVTPSAWNTDRKALQQGLGASINGSVSSIAFVEVGSNFYNVSGLDNYIGNGFASKYRQLNGEHIFYTAPSGTAGNAISFTQAMTLDASGRLLVGTTSNLSGEPLQIDGNGVGSTVYTLLIRNTSTSTSVYNVARWGQNASGSAAGYIGTGGSAVGNPAFQNTFVVGTQSSNPLVFNTNDAEKARIPAAGGMVIGTAALATTATDGFLYVPTCAGAPTGTPTTQTGTAPIVVDTTNNKLYFYSGGQWRDAGP